MNPLDEARAAICAAPRDDAPRRAYADLVEASDPAYAEYIRLALDEAVHPGGRLNVSHPQATRFMVLEQQNKARWCAYLSERVRGAQLNRGFVEWVMLEASAFLEQAEVLYRLAPIFHLDLDHVRPVLEALLDSPHLERVLSLDLSRSELTDDDARRIAASKWVGSLRYLELRSNQITDAGVEALAASETLKTVDYLGLRWNPGKDPTPQHADEYDATSPEAEALMTRYGRRRWLDAKPPRFEWPPSRMLLRR